VLALSGPGLLEFIEAVLAKGAQFRFRARGFSMHPFIQDGDVITVLPLDGHAPKPGEVVAFCHPQTQKLVVHRVLAAFAEGCVIRGDSASEADGFISLENVLGTVGRVEREGRQVRLGLGPERRLIAWLSRHNLLQPFIRRTWHVLRPALGKIIK
jgi:hypothetical protein